MEPSRGGAEPALEGRGHCGVGRSRRGGGGVSSNGRGLLVVRLASCVESQLATGAPGGTPRPVSRGSDGSLCCLFGSARPRSSSERKPAPGSRRFAAECLGLGLSGASQTGLSHSSVIPTWGAPSRQFSSSQVPPSQAPSSHPISCQCLPDRVCTCPKSSGLLRSGSLQSEASRVEVHSPQVLTLSGPRSRLNLRNRLF